MVAEVAEVAVVVEAAEGLGVHVLNRLLARAMDETKEWMWMEEEAVRAAAEEKGSITGGKQDGEEAAEELCRPRPAAAPPAPASFRAWHWYGR